MTAKYGVKKFDGRNDFQYMALCKVHVCSALNVVLKVGRVPRLIQAEKKSKIIKKVQSGIILLQNERLAIAGDSSLMWQNRIYGQ